MSLLVEADEQEPAVLAVARLVGELESSESLASEAAGLLEKGDTPALLSRLVGSSLLTAAGEKDAEAAFAVLAHAAGTLPADRALAAVSQILQRVADVKADAPALRLRILFAVFNAVPHARCRFTVLLRALQFATATEQAEAVAHTVPRIDAWAAEWALDAADQRALRLAVYELLEKTKGAGKESLAALVAYLALFEVRARRPGCARGPRARLTRVASPLRARQGRCWLACATRRRALPRTSSPHRTCSSATC